MDCPRCGVQNETANAVCSYCGAALRAPDGAAASARVFRDPTRLTKLVQGLLIGVAVLAVASVASEFMQLQLLMRMRDGGFDSEAEMMSAAESNDLRHHIISIGTILLFVGTAIAFSMWTYRVSSNVHALGCRGLRFKPGWAVGWYFIPIANLWVPYQAMKEIWRASKNPGGWESETTGSVLGWWWFCWIVSAIVGNISNQWTLRAETIDEIVATVRPNVVASMIDLAGAILAFLVVKRIGAFQALAADRSLGQVFA